MKLQKLLENVNILKIVGYIGDIEIENISLSSKQKGGNWLFIAQKGGVFDGHNFLEEAVLNGACALVVEKINPNFTNIPQILVKNTRIAVCELASGFYGNPKEKLRFIGITGTNGKTSCSLFLGKILNENGIKTAVVGTLGIFIENEVLSNNLTTPDPIVFHKLLQEFVKRKVEVVVMEVSAHAIFFQKLCNINFEVGVLTNITEDHLDFFKTMKNYAITKLSWVFSLNVKHKLINIDDIITRKLVGQNNSFLTYGIKNKSDFWAEYIDSGNNETNFCINVFGKTYCVSTKLVGEFNVYNACAVVGACVSFGLNIEDVLQTLKQCEAPKGRFNSIKFGNKTIVVDFAHTPDGLEKVLKTSRAVCKNKLFVLFGCGGDRDKIKRPIMGKIASELADFCILTSDNPRFEKPESILFDIEKGIVGNNYYKIPDRKKAIKKLLSMLGDNDFAIICGKGGEEYQDINGIKIPYNDFEEVENFIKETKI